MSSLSKSGEDGGRGKPSVNSAIMRGHKRPEARRANHDQDEPRLISGEGPNPPAVQYWGMSCG